MVSGLWKLTLRRVSWLLNNTCESIEALQPLYYSQGLDFCRRMQAAVDFPDFLTDAKHRESYVDMIRHDEQQTLEQLYGPRTKIKKADTFRKSTDPLISEYLTELELRRKGFQDRTCRSCICTSGGRTGERGRDGGRVCPASQETKPVPCAQLAWDSQRSCCLCTNRSFACAILVLLNRHDRHVPDRTWAEVRSFTQDGRVKPVRERRVRANGQDGNGEVK